LNETALGEANAIPKLRSEIDLCQHAMNWHGARPARSAGAGLVPDQPGVAGDGLLTALWRRYA
jgi:hypothetical protein